MADEKLIIKVDLESGDVKSFNKSLKDTADKAGRSAGLEFARKFNSNAGKSIGDLSRSLLKFSAIATGVATTVGSIFGIKAIRAAGEQEEAVTRLNRSLQQSGDFSIKASQDLQTYASSLQDVTEFGDETILNQIALAKSFGATNEQSKQIVETATGLSKALGIDLESATRNVAKTLGGYAGELGETIPQLKEFTTDQLKAGEGAKLLNSIFGEQAKNLNTFQFFIKQASGAFGDLLEAIGSVITKSPIILKSLKSLTETFKASTKEVSNFVNGINLITDVAIPLSQFGDQIITTVIAPIELLGNLLKTTQGFINTFVSGVVAGFGQLGLGAAKIIELFGGESETSRALRDFAETSGQVFDDNAKNATQSFQNILDFPLSDQLTVKNEELRIKLQEQNLIIQEESRLAQKSLNGSILEQNDKLQEGLTEGSKKLPDSLKQVQKQVNSIVNQGIARSISGGIQNLTNSLLSGEDAFKNFGNFILTTFGDLAIQLGQFFIAQGIAIEALNAVSGTGAIAAGAGLVALGTILKSFTSSGGSSSGGGGGVAAVGATPGEGQLGSGVADPQAVTQAEERVNLSLNIEGSLIRQSELSDFVSEALEESGSRNATVIPSLRTS